jgi:hypothetical protein
MSIHHGGSQILDFFARNRVARRLNKLLGLFSAAAILSGVYAASAAGAPSFSDDFESGNLDNWVIDGRQLAGTNIANTVSRYGSTMGHLYKTSFTEVTFERSFDYEPMLRFNFDMEVAASSQSAPPAYYGSSGVDFIFRDAGDNDLGFVWYLYATTNFVFDEYNPDPTREVVAVSPGSLEHYSLGVEDMLALITIDDLLIDSVTMRFRTYSSTYPYPSVSAELWVDNVNTNPMDTNPIPEPPAVLLFGSALAGLGVAGWQRRKGDRWAA